jgi:CRP-like cAMP-binding protein
MEDNVTAYNSELKEYMHLFKRIVVPAKTILLQEGEISNVGYFIEQGCVRLWFNNDGKDVTFQFFFEGQGVSSIESFNLSKPSLFSIESIEPCVLYQIKKEDIQFMLSDSPKFRAKFESHIIERLYFYQRLFLSHLKYTPQQRYNQLIEEYPELIQRIPQHYIASYLGITPVSLSRIRARH